MNTQEIISFTAHEFKKQFSDLNLDFSSWLNVYRFWESRVELADISTFLPLREPVVKLIYKHLYQFMPFDKEYVLKNYEVQRCGIDFLLYPCKSPHKVIVFFTGYSTRKTYNRYSWFWDEKERWQNQVLYIFVRDPENLWYSGTEYYQKLKKLFLSIAQEYNLKFEHFIFIGGSMGGYGALRYGLSLNVGQIIAIHPQLTLEATKFHHDNTWYETIKDLGDKFVPITELVTGKLPMIYLEFGNYKADKLAAQELIKAYDAKEGLLVVSKHAREDHVTEQPDFERLHSIMNFFNNI